MPGIINSAPDCVTHAAGSEKARVDDSADFILQDDYSDCAGFMTFGPGSTYGDEGTGADTALHDPDLAGHRRDGGGAGGLGPV